MPTLENIKLEERLQRDAKQDFCYLSFNAATRHEDRREVIGPDCYKCAITLKVSSQSAKSGYGTIYNTSVLKEFPTPQLLNVMYTKKLQIQSND